MSNGTLQGAERSILFEVELDTCNIHYTYLLGLNVSHWWEGDEKISEA